MRKTCLKCCRKHIAQAEILLNESKLGYRTHKWLALGHLAEAEHECIEKFPILANQIRTQRLKIEDDYESDFYALELIKEINALIEIRGVDGRLNENLQKLRKGKNT